MPDINHGNFNVTPIHPALGAEISGIDLSQGLDDETFNTIDDLFNQYSVIFFRNQTLTPEQHIEFTKKFGSLMISTISRYVLQAHPEILLVSNVEEDGKLIGLADAGRFWHTDMSYVECPPRCSIMNAIEVPAATDGAPLGNTCFVSTAAAHDALPDDMKTRIDGLQSIHSFKNKPRVPGSKRDDATKRQKNTGFDDVIHPVARTHPATGRKCLYITAGECIGIVGMDDEEALPLLDHLADHTVQEKFMYCHQWQAGDVLMWDNCALQHKAIEDFALPQRRVMHRTTVQGPKPFI